MSATARAIRHLSVLKEFTETPGPRYAEDGKFSGRQFLDELLNPRFNEALSQDAVLFVDLDGTAGYATSFLEESFGGLARLHTAPVVLDHIDFKSEDEPYLKEDIRRYIREGEGGTR